MRGVGEDRGWRCHGRGSAMSGLGAGAFVPLLPSFSFSFCVEEKIKVSGRAFESRWPHSACETVIAVHMVK